MLRQIMAASRVAFADMRTLYTPTTWAAGWLGRILAQVIFFALIGILLESTSAVVFLVIGQAVMVITLDVFRTVASSTWEQRTGTLPLLLATPAHLWAVLYGRSLQWVPSAVATSSVALFVVSPMFGIGWGTWEAILVLPVLVAISLSMYSVALTLATLALRRPRWRNVLGNLAPLVIMLTCGVVVPLTYWPQSVQVLAQSIPLTHGLKIVRDLEQSTVNWDVLWTLLMLIFTGVLWTLLAIASISRFASTGRRGGTIGFSP